MRYKIILTISSLWVLSSFPTLGQAIADFDFEDNSNVPTSLLKNSVEGALDALRIHPNAKEKDGGVYVVQDESTPGDDNIDLDIPEALFTPYGTIYLEWEWMVQEEFAWLIHGRGFEKSGIFHDANQGFNLRYYTQATPDAEPLYHHTNFKPPLISPLEKNVISKVGFYYNQEEGLAYLFVNGEQVWRSDSHFTPTPGEPLIWKYEDDFLRVGANTNGEGSSTPSIYRFRIMETPCPEIIPPQATAEEVCPGEPALLSASGGEEGNYRWYESENAKKAIEGETSSTFTTPPLSAPTQYYVSLADGFCESERIAVAVNILPLPDAPAVEDGENCGPGNVMLQASGGTEGSYRWYRSSSEVTPIEGAINSTFTTENLNATKAYYVAIAGENCESERVRVEAIIHPIPEEPVSQTIPRCGPGEVIIDIQTQTSTDASAFRWYRRQEDTSPSHEDQSNILKVQASKDTVIYVSSFNGHCSSEKVPVYIKINPIPEIDGGEEKNVIKGESIQLLASGNITNVKWFPSAGLDMDNVLNPIASPAFTTTYVVTGTNEFGCEASDTVTVHVLNEYPVPNAFSPNNDGHNDVWEIKDLNSKFPNCRVIIFNRWGNQVFYSEGYQQAWDGTLNGQELETGTYYFTLLLDNEHEPVKGTLALIR